MRTISSFGSVFPPSFRSFPRRSKNPSMNSSQSDDQAVQSPKQCRCRYPSHQKSILKIWEPTWPIGQVRCLNLTLRLPLLALIFNLASLLVAGPVSLLFNIMRDYWTAANAFFTSSMTPPKSNHSRTWALGTRWVSKSRWKFSSALRMSCTVWVLMR